MRKRIVHCLWSLLACPMPEQPVAVPAKSLRPEAGGMNTAQFGSSADLCLCSLNKQQIRFQCKQQAQFDNNNNNDNRWHGDLSKISAARRWPHCVYVIWPHPRQPCDSNCCRQSSFVCVPPSLSLSLCNWPCCCCSGLGHSYCYWELHGKQFKHSYI